jgi:hypothetical protein
MPICSKRTMPESGNFARPTLTSLRRILLLPSLRHWPIGKLRHWRQQNGSGSASRLATASCPSIYDSCHLNLLSWCGPSPSVTRVFLLHMCLRNPNEHLKTSCHAPAPSPMFSPTWSSPVRRQNLTALAPMSVRLHYCTTRHFCARGDVRAERGMPPTTSVAVRLPSSISSCIYIPKQKTCISIPQLSGRS